MSIDVGDAYRLRFRNLSPAGDLVDASSMRLVVTALADGSETEVDPVTPASTGVYEHDFSTTVAGLHRAVWTGTPYGSHVETFDVRPARYDIISLAAAKAHLNIRADSSAHDEELREFIEALTTVIEGPDALGEAVVKRPIVEPRLLRMPARRVSLHTPPVLELTAITDLNGSLSWDVADFHVDGETGIVTALDTTFSLFGLVEFSYVAGYEVIPANVTLAAKIALQEWWRTQRVGGGGPRFVGASTGDENSALIRAGWGLSVLPPEARQLLGAPMSGIA